MQPTSTTAITPEAIAEEEKKKKEEDQNKDTSKYESSTTDEVKPVVDTTPSANVITPLDGGMSLAGRGEQTTTSTQTSGTLGTSTSDSTQDTAAGYDEGTIKRAENLKNTQIENAQLAADVEQRQLNNANDAVILESAKTQEALEEKQVDQQDRDNTVADSLEKMDAEAEKYGNMKVDPARLWHDASTGQKIGLTLALMIGGAASAASGQKNYAYEMLNKAIDADIAAQEKEIDTFGSALTKKESIFNRVYEVTGDRLLAKFTTKMAMIKNQMSEAQAIMDKETTPEAVKAKLANDIAEFEAKYNEVAAKRVTRATQLTNNTKNETTIQTGDSTTKTKQWKPFDFDSFDSTVEMNAQQKKELAETVHMIDSLDNTVKAFEIQRDAAKEDWVQNPRIREGMMKAARALGWKVDQNDLNVDNKANRLLFSIVKTYSGAQVSEGELKRWKDTIPGLKDDPENALAILQDFAREQKSKYKILYNAYTSKHAADFLAPKAEWDHDSVPRKESDVN